MKGLFKWIDGKSLVLGIIMGLIGASLILYLIPSASAASQAPPCPIFISLQTIPDYANVGLHVVLRDGGAIISQQVSIEGGEVLFELGGIAECKAYTATVLECEANPVCTKEVSFNPNGAIVWDLAQVIPVTTTVPTTTTIPVTTTTLPCPDCECVCEICPVCEVCPTCPPFDLTAMLLSGGAGVLALLGAIALYFKAYKNKARIQTYNKYITSTGRTAYHWVTRFSRSD
jgi:hypothetical protein